MKSQTQRAREAKCHKLYKTCWHDKSLVKDRTSMLDGSCPPHIAPGLDKNNG